MKKLAMAIALAGATLFASAPAIAYPHHHHRHYRPYRHYRHGPYCHRVWRYNHWERFCR